MKGGSAHFFRYRFPALVWAAAIFAASSIPGSRLPKIAYVIDDEVIHAAIFFVFGLLFYRALEPSEASPGVRWKRLLISVAVVLIYGLSDELHQALVPGRTPDIKDITADAVGGILSAALIYFRSRFRQRAQV